MVFEPFPGAVLRTDYLSLHMTNRNGTSIMFQATAAGLVAGIALRGDLTPAMHPGTARLERIDRSARFRVRPEGDYRAVCSVLHEINR